MEKIYIEVKLEPDTLENFPRLKNKRTWWLVYKRYVPNLNLKRNCIRILIEGQKTTSIWHESNWTIKEPLSVSIKKPI